MDNASPIKDDLCQTNCGVEAVQVTTDRDTCEADSVPVTLSLVTGASWSIRSFPSYYVVNAKKDTEQPAAIHEHDSPTAERQPQETVDDAHTTAGLHRLSVAVATPPEDTADTSNVTPLVTVDSPTDVELHHGDMYGENPPLRPPGLEHDGGELTVPTRRARTLSQSSQLSQGKTVSVCLLSPEIECMVRTILSRALTAT